MAFKDFFSENIVNNNSNSLKLYHGTLIDNIESITAKGLTPSVGEFTKSLYNKEAMPLVFANDLSGARSVYCALSSQIQRKIGKKNHITQYTHYSFIIKKHYYKNKSGFIKNYSHIKL